MMTESMKLTSRHDAEIWAHNMNGGSMSETQERHLADWIWENKPAVGCTYEHHPLYAISDDCWVMVGDE